MGAFIAFTAMFALDFVYGLYTRRIADGHGVRAGFWAGLVIFFNAIVTLTYVGNPSLIVFAVLGAFVGTWAAVKWDKDGK